MQRIRRRVSSGAKRNMSIRTVEYNNPGVVLANTAGLIRTADDLNNVGRLCSLPGDKTPRTWMVHRAYRVPSNGNGQGATVYVVRNGITGAFKLAGLSVTAPEGVPAMGNLY
jgi:hypothetical protein